MARRKLSDDEKKPKIGFTINKELDVVMNNYIKNNDLNRSNYIETLIKNDMIQRGYEVKNDFEK
jgi:hypothetical protein